METQIPWNFQIQIGKGEIVEGEVIVGNVVKVEVGAEEGVQVNLGNGIRVEVEAEANGGAGVEVEDVIGIRMTSLKTERRKKIRKLKRRR